jgi:hypothetical protein
MSMLILFIVSFPLLYMNQVPALLGPGLISTEVYLTLLLVFVIITRLQDKIQ